MRASSAADFTGSKMPSSSAFARRNASTVTRMSAGAVGALVADALEQFVFLRLDAVDLDPGLLGEVAVELFVCLVVAGGVVFSSAAVTAPERPEGGRHSRARRTFLLMVCEPWVCLRCDDTNDKGSQLQIAHSLHY